MRLKVYWASLIIVGRKFTVLLCFFALYFREISKYIQAAGGAYIWRGDLTEGFLCYDFGGLVHGAHFRNFTVFDRTIETIINR